MRTDNSSYNISGIFYNYLSEPVKGTEVTLAETELIESIVGSKDATILDIGAGTGRHFIPLNNKGYAIYGLEDSSVMISVLERQLDNLDRVCNSNFWEFSEKVFGANKFDLLILFWNVINEIALSKKDLREFFFKAKKFLKPNGKILINSDNPKNFNFGSLAYTVNFIKNGEEFTLNSRVKRFNRFSNVTLTEENIVRKNGKGQELQRLVSYLKQKWWFKKELIREAAKQSFKVREHSIKWNDEMYLEFYL